MSSIVRSHNGWFFRSSVRLLIFEGPILNEVDKRQLDISLGPIHLEQNIHGAIFRGHVLFKTCDAGRACALHHKSIRVKPYYSSKAALWRWIGSLKYKVDPGAPSPPASRAARPSTIKNG